jgi:hypothetical protein
MSSAAIRIFFLAIVLLQCESVPSFNAALTCKERASHARGHAAVPERSSAQQIDELHKVEDMCDAIVFTQKKEGKNWAITPGKSPNGGLTAGYVRGHIIPKALGTDLLKLVYVMNLTDFIVVLCCLQEDPETLRTSSSSRGKFLRFSFFISRKRFD